MRQIKFRAWDKKKKKMFKPYVLTFPLNGNIAIAPCQSKKVDAILMQYTGIEDTKGREIYEGDICTQLFNGKRTTGEVIIETTRGVVVGGIPIWPHYVEIIGNLYENPNLLPNKVEGIDDGLDASSELKL